VFDDKCPSAVAKLKSTAVFLNAKINKLYSKLVNTCDKSTDGKLDEKEVGRRGRGFPRGAAAEQAMATMIRTSTGYNLAKRSSVAQYGLLAIACASRADIGNTARKA